MWCQVGSHFHFVEVNPYLVFDRQLAYGYRLNILAGTAVRFEVGGGGKAIFRVLGFKGFRVLGF